MKKISCSIAFLFILMTSHSQLNRYDLNSQPISKSMNSVGADNAGNFIVTGTFSTSITFGPFTLTNNMPFSNIGTAQFTSFIVKFLPNKTATWAKAIQIVPISNYSGVSFVQINGVTTDASGNIYIIGIFKGRMRLDNVTLTSSKGATDYTDDLFVSKIASNGSVVFVKSEGTGDDNNCLPEWGSSVTTDNFGNVYASGRIVHKVFKPAVSCSCGGSTITAVAYCAYLVKYSSTGQKIFEKKLFNSQASSSDCGRYLMGGSVTSDGSNVYLTGTIFGSVSFGNTTLSSGSIDNSFVTKMDGSGNFIWAKSVSNSANHGGGLLLDNNNSDVYLTGTFSSGTISFGGPSLSTTSSIVYLAKYSSSSGNCSWAVTSGVLNSKGTGVTKLSNGNLAMLLIAPPQPSISPTYFGIKEFSTSDGSNVNSTVASISSPIYTVGEGFGSTPGGFFYTQNLKGSYDFAGTTISSTQSLSSDYADMILVEYTPAAPVVSQAQIVQKSSLHKINLYPNPASNQITIQNANNKILGKVSIYDMTGKVLYEKFIAGSQAIVNVRQFSSGMYYVKADGLSVKFTKQ